MQELRSICQQVELMCSVRHKTMACYHPVVTCMMHLGLHRCLPLSQSFKSTRCEPAVFGHHLAYVIHVTAVAIVHTSPNTNRTHKFAGTAVGCTWVQGGQWVLADALYQSADLLPKCCIRTSCAGLLEHFGDCCIVTCYNPQQ